MKRDDRSLFGFYQGDGELRAEGEQVLSEQALGQRPLIGQLLLGFQPGVRPHCRRNGAVVDAVAGLGIVGDYLPGAAVPPSPRSSIRSYRYIGVNNSDKFVWPERAFEIYNFP